MKKSNLTSLISILILCLTASAANAAQGLKVHTWHIVSAMAGTWNARLQAINEQASFVDAKNQAIDSFTLDTQQAYKYGANFDPKDDFNVAYTLTLTEKGTTNFAAKTCVFVITAKGPADPDIQVLKYNNAQCSYNVVSVGENFIVG